MGVFSGCSNVKPLATQINTCTKMCKYLSKRFSFISLLRASNPEVEARGVIQKQLVRVCCCSITDRCSWRIRRLHPEAHRERGQTGHAPDIGVFAHSVFSEIKSIICEKRHLHLVSLFFKVFLMIVSAVLTN